MTPINHSHNEPNINGSMQIDRQHLHQVHTSIMQLNQLRLEYTRDSLNPQQRIFLDTLPLLLHFNHPVLPGYIARDTPAKIVGFQPSEQQLHQLTLVAKSFQAYQQQQPKQQADILGIFMMGSAGSIAYNKKSDFDIWVCYRSGLNAEHLRQLKEKCSHLQQWASRLYLDVSLFLMNDNNFCRGQDSTMDKESSGSTQHYLLLDEFYRTCIHLAGLLPIWLFISNENKKDYHHSRTEIINNRFLPNKEFIDFGPIPQIPPSEFISAAIWQLYKAIESPYKSLLKLLILEAYVYQPKNSLLVSELSKKKSHENVINKIENNLINNDPYLQLYDYLENYLKKSNQRHRLDLLRKCFYIKVNIALSKHKGDKKQWQHKALLSLIKKWGWSNDYLSHLDNRNVWKVKPVATERKELVSEITHSYRFIVDFFKQSNIKLSSSTKEINILGRKLNAAFSIKSGKISWINPSISKNITETNIIINEINNNKLHYWQAYNNAGDLIKENASIAFLLTWLHCNNIIGKETLIDYNSPNKEEFYTLKSWLEEQLPTSIKPGEHKHYTEKSKTIKIAISINKINKRSGMIEKNWLSFLANSIDHIDIICTNSWNEVFHRHFNHQALVSMIRHYCDLFYQEKNTFTAKINIHIKNNAINRIIQNELLAFITELQLFFKESINGYYVFIEDNLKIIIFYKKGKAVIDTCKNTKDIIEKLKQPNVAYQALKVRNETNYSHILSCIDKYCCRNAIQVFFIVNNNHTEITIADERGTFYQKNIIYDRDIHTLKPLHRFLRTISERRIESQLGSNNIGPMNITPIEFYELKQHQGIWQGKRQAINSNLEHFNFINVIATIENIAAITHPSESYQPIDFTIHCDDEAFSSEQYQDDIYSMVARYIIKKRQHHGRYPCYITDIDLHSCQQQVTTENIPQTVHYLKVQAFLEERINHALTHII